MNGRSEKESELFTAVEDALGIIQIQLRLMKTAGRHYNPSNTSDCSTLQESHWKEIGNDTWPDVLQQEERIEKIVKDMCPNCTPRNRVMK